MNATPKVETVARTRRFLREATGTEIPLPDLPSNGAEVPWKYPSYAEIREHIRRAELERMQEIRRLLLALGAALRPAHADRRDEPGAGRWKRVATIACVAGTTALVVGLALARPAQAALQVSGPGACGVRAVDNESFVTCDGDEPAPAVDATPASPATPAVQAIAARQAWEMKRALGARMLLVDIRGAGEILRFGMPLGADVNIPYLRGPRRALDGAGLRSAATQFNPRFLFDADAALRAAGLGHGAPVVLLCRTGELSRMAAQLMREHGYERVFVVADGFEGAHEGWKKAGLPWSAKADPAWINGVR